MMDKQGVEQSNFTEPEHVRYKHGKKTQREQALCSQSTGQNSFYYRENTIDFFWKDSSS